MSKIKMMLTDVCQKYRLKNGYLIKKMSEVRDMVHIVQNIFNSVNNTTKRRDE